MARRVTKPSDDPLMQGRRKMYGYSLPEPMGEALKEMSMRDGVRSVSEYVAHLLLAAIRQREAELDAQTESTPTQRGPKKPGR